ncbi:MAG: hypothetical protein HY903_17010 [Deltaproteobacteria bacterium]|nr:hypothetical protein [Deltaproteobacteria bacterium]
MMSSLYRGFLIVLLLGTVSACGDDNTGGNELTAAPSAPVAVTVGLQTIDEGATVTLDGSSSYDADNDLVGYAWTQNSGPAVALVNPTSAKATFTAPSVGDTTILRFVLTVTDSGGRTGVINAEVTVIDLNAAPVVNVPAHTVAYADTVIALTGTATDPDGTVASVKWTQVSGDAATLANDTTLSASATLPDVGQNRELIFALTATDNEGKTGVAEIGITVKPVAETLAFVGVRNTALRNTAWPAFTVEIKNASGLRITGGDPASYTVVVSLKAGGPAGTLGGTLAATAVAGVASFSRVRFDQVTPTGGDVFLQANVLDPAVGPFDSPAVKITWPTKIPGKVTAPELTVNAVALVADAGNQDMIVGGSFFGAGVSFALDGDTTKAVDAAVTAAFVARYHGVDGSLEWVRVFADPSGTSAAEVKGLAVATATGKIYIAIDHTGALDLPRDGTTPLQVIPATTGTGYVTVASLAGGGAGGGSADWASTIGDATDDVPTTGTCSATTLQLDGSNSPIVLGTFSSTVDFDPAGATFADHTADGLSDAFLLKLAATDGKLGWRFVTGSAVQLGAAPVADSGVALAVPRVSGGMWIAGQLANGINGSFFLQVTSNGTLATPGVKYLGPGTFAEAICLDPTGQIFLAGGFTDQTNFDPTGAGTALIAQSPQDMFLANYTANGTLTYAVQFGDFFPMTVATLSYRDAAADSLVISGTFEGDVDFDPTIAESVATANNEGAFLLSLEPSGAFEWVNVMDPGPDAVAWPQAVATTSNRIGFVGAAAIGVAPPVTFDVDPAVTTVDVQLGAGRHFFIDKMNDQGLTVP